MKKNVISTSKEFAKVAKCAKVELKSAFSSVYVIANLLNKACKGDLVRWPSRDTRRIFLIEVKH